jgi:uncharacterized membrane protein
VSEAVADELELGPIDFIVVEYPGAQMTGEALPHLIDLVESGTINILDVALIRKADEGGTFQTLRPADFVAAGAPIFALFEGAVTGLLDDEDLRQVAEVIDDGSAGLILVYENSWAGPFATALRRAGGQLVAGGRIPTQVLLEALEADSDNADL